MASSRGSLGAAVADDGPEFGALSMSRDDLLGRRLLDGGQARFLMRSHGWTTPVITVGRAQQPPPELLEEARAAGVDVARRPTGGGWLLHLPGDLSVTFVAAGPLRAGDLRGAAGAVAEAIARGLAGTGRAAAVAAGQSGKVGRAEICFQRVDREEVAVGDVKVAGVALARVGRSALVQTAIPLVPAEAGLASFESRWDPARSSAAEVLAGTEAPRLHEQIAPALGAVLGERLEPWVWPGSWLQDAETGCEGHALLTIEREGAPR